jgi:response regulator RpfG family c-di-GMP phosphodiesterase
LEKVLFPKILITYNDKAVIKQMKRILSEDNYRFVEAFDEESAVRIAKKEPISLIVLDLTLLNMNGYEIISRLKQDVRTEHVPILISSGYDVDEERLGQVDSERVMPIIRKPLQPDELRNKVKKLMMGD